MGARDWSLSLPLAFGASPAAHSGAKWGVTGTAVKSLHVRLTGSSLTPSVHPEGSRRWSQVLRVLMLTRETRWGSWLLAPAWPRPGWCGHVQGEQVAGRVFSAFEIKGSKSEAAREVLWLLTSWLFA